MELPNSPVSACSLPTPYQHSLCCSLFHSHLASCEGSILAVKTGHPAQWCREDARQLVVHAHTQAYSPVRLTAGKLTKHEFCKRELQILRVFWMKRYGKQEVTSVLGLFSSEGEVHRGPGVSSGFSEEAVIGGNTSHGKGSHLKRSDGLGSVKRCPYDGGGSHSSSVKAAHLEAHLKCLDINACRMGSTQRELEVCTQMENCDDIGFMRIRNSTAVT